MNLEERIKKYEIELKDYIPIYGWTRYQAKGFKAGFEVSKKGVKKYFEGLKHWGVRTMWLSLYNAGVIYSLYMWDKLLNLGLLDKIKTLFNE